MYHPVLVATQTKKGKTTNPILQNFVRGTCELFWINKHKAEAAFFREILFYVN